jgi:6-pyruvoyltetrahydropterin/6-carboxytetrahydropterin synthase
MMEIVKEFTFDAAHDLAANVAEGHPYSRLHGHSFRVEIHLRGEPDPKTGWIVDFAVLDRAIQPLRQRLDHSYLNEIAGLERPTLETIGRWIFDQVRWSVPQVSRVVVRRGSLGEAAIYEPD